MYNNFKVIWFLLLSCAVCAQSDNPFDVERKSDTVKVAPVEDIKTFEESTKIGGDNPFDISHIPIRKNQYKQIEGLNTAKSTEKENISITYLPFWILVCSLCLLAFVLYSRKNHVLSLLRSLSNDNFLKLQQYEQNGGRSSAFFVGYLLFIINFALFIYLLARQLFEFSDWSYWLFFLIVVLFFIGKHIMLFIASWIFEFQKEASVYNFTIVTVRNILGIVFFSLNILLVFGPSIWTKGIAILGSFFFIIFLLSRYYKGLKHARKFVNNAFFHFFLYFCAFEFCPWVIVFKLMTEFV